MNTLIQLLNSISCNNTINILFRAYTTLVEQREDMYMWGGRYVYVCAHVSLFKSHEMIIIINLIQFNKSYK